MNIPVREGETIEGSRTTRNRPYPVLKCSSPSITHTLMLCVRSLRFDRNLEDGRKNTPLFMPDPGHASLSVSWVGHLRGCNSHGGAAPRRAFGAGGCPFTGRDRSGDPLHTELWFWRLLLALNAVATPEAVLGECIAMLLRQSIEPLRRLHR